MTLQQAFELLGLSGTKKYQLLADILKISRDAIYQWNQNRIPKLREYQVREAAKIRNNTSNMDTVAQDIA